MIFTWGKHKNICAYYICKMLYLSIVWILNKRESPHLSLIFNFLKILKFTRSIIYVTIYFFPIVINVQALYIWYLKYFQRKKYSIAFWVYSEAIYLKLIHNKNDMYMWHSYGKETKSRYSFYCSKKWRIVNKIFLLRPSFVIAYVINLK